MNIIKKLIENHELTKEEYIKLLDMVDNPAVVEALKGAAVRLKKEHYGNKVYTRGLIEFKIYCKNGCY
ncbi:MAG: [FeFe] hydrogenase H-cluster radical SAM maturase HydE, partial [Acetivibrio ethanolgignens]